MKNRLLDRPVTLAGIISLLASIITLLQAVPLVEVQGEMRIPVNSDFLKGLSTMFMLYGAGALWWKLTDLFKGKPESGQSRIISALMAGIATGLIMAPFIFVWQFVFTTTPWEEALFQSLLPALAGLAAVANLAAWYK